MLAADFGLGLVGRKSCGVSGLGKTVDNFALKATQHLVAYTAGLLLFSLFSAGAAESLQVGDAFPALDQFQLEGQLPGPLQGKIVLVDFWASWCGPCKDSFPVMTELHKRFAARGLVIITVSVDEEKKAMERFLKKNPVPFCVVRDVTQKLAATVNARTMPTSFLLDAQGRVCFVHNGFKEETGLQYEKEIGQLLESLSKQVKR